MITVLGEVTYIRTYFVSKKEKKYKYLTDEIFGIKVHDRMEQVISAKLVELSTDLSYRKSGKEILVPISGQTVMNKIRTLSQIKHEVLEEANKEAFIKYMNKLKGFTDLETKIKEIEDCENYMQNHWEGIEIKATEDACVLGCSAESHVNHILSARMSSRPLGWCYEGADQMSKLRVFRANKGNVLDLFKEQGQEEKRRTVAKTIIKSGTNKLKSQYLEGLNNIFVFNQGKKNPVFEAVRNLKYYKRFEV